MLLSVFLQLTLGLTEVFGQKRVALRAQRLMLMGLLTVGRRWISRMISTAGRDQEDWSADYRVFSKRDWKLDKLFLLLIRAAIKLYEGSYVIVAVDDTGVSRSGPRVKAARWMRDPLSPKFQVNLKRGIRFMHFSLLLRRSEAPELCRGIPIGFDLVPIVKKPGTKATHEEIAAYKVEKKTMNLSMHAKKAIERMRGLLDRAGAQDKHLVIVGDGGYCNRTVMRQTYDRTTVLVRTRKDAALCDRAPASSRRIYGSRRFTPDQIRNDDGVAWQTGSFFHGAARHDLRYKQTVDVLWQRGTARSPVRVFVLAPTPYQRSRNTRKCYRDPGYLLTQDLQTDGTVLIQAYLDRWQIEVNHRDMKDVLGLGDAQVWADQAVERQPAFVVASYSLLLLAGLEAYGPKRTGHYAPLPKWRRGAKRPSCLDLVTQLRKEALSAGDQLEKLGIRLANDTLTLKAAA
jgi:hypothetical protein